MNQKIIQLIQIGNIIAVILTIIVNGLANLLPIGGKNTAEISDNIPNLFVPAGITFAIWGIIYFLIIFFAVYLAKDLFKKEKTTKQFLEKISYLFIIASIANIIWIFLWHYELITVSILPMFVLFISLLFIYLRLDIGNKTISLKDRLFIHIPISVYIGWITVATIANVTAVLVVNGWDGFGITEEFWTILIIIIAMIITVLILYKRKDFAYATVIIWALLGIYIKRSANDPIYGVQTQIANTALIAILVIVIISVILLIYHYLKKQPLFG